MVIWKPIKGLEGLYEVSNTGLIRSLKRPIIRFMPGKQLKPFKRRDGYIAYGLGRKRKAYIHRIVAETFIGPSPFPKATINHKNGKKSDNRPENLEWVSQSENIKHAWRTGLIATGRFR